MAFRSRFLSAFLGFLLTPTGVPSANRRLILFSLGLLLSLQASTLASHPSGGCKTLSDPDEAVVRILDDSIHLYSPRSGLLRRLDLDGRQEWSLDLVEVLRHRPGGRVGPPLDLAVADDGSIWILREAFGERSSLIVLDAEGAFVREIALREQVAARKLARSASGRILIWGTPPHILEDLWRWIRWDAPAPAHPIPVLFKVRGKRLQPIWRLKLPPKKKPAATALSRWQRARMLASEEGVWVFIQPDELTFLTNASELWGGRLPGVNQAGSRRQEFADMVDDGGELLILTRETPSAVIENRRRSARVHSLSRIFRWRPGHGKVREVNAPSNNRRLFGVLPDGSWLVADGEECLAKFEVRSAK